MTYVLPQVLVFQEFTQTPAAVANPLRAHIAGPHAWLVRYLEATEQALGRLGFYDRLADASYSWPHKPGGSLIDQSYTKVWLKNALLNYFTDLVEADSTITKLAGFNNRVHSDTVNFIDNGLDFPRDSVLLRDVQPGDIVRVRGVRLDTTAATLWTYVKRILGDVVAAVVGSVAVEIDNIDTQGSSDSVTKTGGPDNCVTLTADSASYDGLASGDVNETYDIVVLASSSGGDFTTASLRIISGSGHDDQADVTPAAAGSPTAIGTRGLTVTFNDDDTVSCSESATADSVSAIDLVTGQRWQVTVEQDFTPPTVTAGGTFTGTADRLYVAEVVRGGGYGADLAADQPQIQVTTTDGSDISGPTNVLNTGVAVILGSQGATITFTGGTGLRKGDKWYVPCTSAFSGNMRTIELGHNLDTTIPSGSEVDLLLFIKKDVLQIEKNRIGSAPLTNWDTSATEITLHSGITAFDESWALAGVVQPLDVWSESSQSYGELFVEYRAWQSTLCNEIDTIQDVADIDDISGALHPDNPLKWGVFKALSNANGAEVKYTSVCDPDDDESWVHVLEQLLGRDDLYSLVPLTRRRTVLDLYAAHVNAQSVAEQALWRNAWFNLSGFPQIPLVSAGSTVPGHTIATTTDGLAALCVISDDPDTTGTQYTVVRCTSGNSHFISNGVSRGDVVRAQFTGDGFGGVTYSEFLIDQVVSEDQLVLQAGPATAINVASKTEVWRNLSLTQEKDELVREAGSWDDRRIKVIWPDTIETAGLVQEGYFLCAALAGLSSGILPQQGMTHLQVAGFTDVPRTLRFGRAQLDAMAGAGIWIVTQDPVVGTVFNRHAVTTADFNLLAQREEMVNRNLDSISFRFKEQFAPFIGVTNVTPSMQAQLALEVDKLIDTLKTETATVRLGGQLVDATVIRFGPHATLLDRYVLVLDVTLPEPFNNLEVHLVV